VPVSPALKVSVSPALKVSVSPALKVFMYTADAHFLDVASAAVAVVAEAVGAAELAGYGHPPGAGSTPAGPNPHLRVKKLASRRSRSLKQRLLRKRSDESQLNSSAPRQFRIFAIAPAAWRYSPRSARGLVLVGPGVSFSLNSDLGRLRQVFVPGEQDLIN
jgi:hypothetical protein